MRRLLSLTFAVLLLFGSVGSALADDGGGMRVDGQRDDWAQVR